MVLSPEQNKQLKILSYQIKSYGADEATLSVYVYDGGIIDFHEDFHVIGTPHYIELDDSLRNLFEEMFEDEIESEYGVYDSGSIDFTVDAKDSTLEIVVNVNNMETNYTSDEFDFEDLRDRNSKFDAFVEKYKSHGHGIIKYEGSGDSGWIEDDMETPNGTVNLRDEQEFVDMLYGILNNYGGWEINEGSQGSFEINFVTETMVHEHGENYEDTTSNTFATLKF